MKKCSKCNKNKDLSCYWKKKTRHGKPGLYSYCNKCANEKKREWRKNNPELYKEQNRRKEQNRSKKSLFIKNQKNQIKRDNLDDSYIIYLIKSNSNIKKDDITQEMIDLHKLQVQLKRALKLTSHGRGK